MRFRSSLLAAAVLVSGILPASAAMRIAEDRGGQIGHYLQAFSMLRSSGERVIIDGNCLSACTILLGVIPKNRMCATGRARLGFHAAWMPDSEGKPITSPMGTQALWNIYPATVRSWIKSRGGLSRKMIFLEGRELARFVPNCTQPAATRSQAKSERRYAPRPVRYEPASAASYRR